ncbi:hypothetical protein Trydic_g8057 [Trypoxylus dichotomus]
MRLEFKLASSQSGITFTDRSQRRIECGKNLVDSERPRGITNSEPAITTYGFIYSRFGKLAEDICLLQHIYQSTSQR